MRRDLFRWELGGFLWTAAAGTAVHFAWGWLGRSLPAAAVCAVNESVWEHMKMLFLPIFLYTMAQLCLEGKNLPDLLAVRAVSALAGTVLIPAAFYTYTGCFGVHLVWADIAIFFLADAAVWLLDARGLRRGSLAAPWMQVAGFLALWLTLFAFVWCTYRPPHLPLWQDAVTRQYGLPRETGGPQSPEFTVFSTLHP